MHEDHIHSLKQLKQCVSLIKTTDKCADYNNTHITYTCFRINSMPRTQSC